MNYLKRLQLHWTRTLKTEKNCSASHSYEPGTLRPSNHTNAEHFFGFYLQVFRQAGPPPELNPFILFLIFKFKLIDFVKVEFNLNSSIIREGIQIQNSKFKFNPTLVTTTGRLFGLSGK